MSDTHDNDTVSTDKIQPAPDRLCLTLWLEGFLNAGFYITILLYWLPSLALFLVGGSENALINSGLVALQKGVMVFSLFSLAFVLLLVLARYVYHYFRSLGSLVIIALFCLLLLSFRFAKIPELWFRALDIEVQRGWAAILSTLLLLLITVVELIRSIGREKREEPPLNGNKVSLPARFMKGLLTAISGFLTGNWVRGLKAKIKEIYHANERLKSEQSKSDDKFLADITSDFKAWTDATKFLLTVIGGLGVVVAVFSFRADEQSALRTIMVLFLLVPGLTCAYMEVFRRRCERIWETLEKQE